MTNKKLLFVTAISASLICKSAWAINQEITCPDGTPDGSKCWQCGSNCYATLTGTTMNITGSGSLDAAGCEHRSDGSWLTRALWRNETINTLNIGKNITSIGQEVFEGISINKLTFEEGSKLTSIGMSAFTHVESAVVLPSTVTSLGNWVFWRAEKLYCTASQMNGVCNNLKNIYRGPGPYQYEIKDGKLVAHEGENIKTYNFDLSEEYDSSNNVIAKYNSKGALTESYNYSVGGKLLSASTYDSEGNVTGSYTYDAGGNLVSAYQNGKAIYLRKRYTIPEADAATQGKGPFRLDITW